MATEKRLDISQLRGYTTYAQKLEKVAQLMAHGMRLALEELNAGQSDRAQTILSHTVKEVENEIDFKKN